MPTLGRARLAFVCFGVIVMTAASVVAGERKDVPDKYKWNLADLYPSEAAWTQAKDAIAKRVPGMAKFKGRLGKSPKDLLAALDEMFDIELRESIITEAEAQIIRDRRLAAMRQILEGHGYAVTEPGAGEPGA